MHATARRYLIASARCKPQAGLSSTGVSSHSAAETTWMRRYDRAVHDGAKLQSESLLQSESFGPVAVVPSRVVLFDIRPH